MSGMGRKAGIAAFIIWLLAVFLGLWFMGVLPLGGDRNGGAEEEQALSAGGDDRTRVWEIVFSGMKFTIPQKGLVLVHESGCLNIRQTDHYLIQIMIEDDTVADMWENMDSKRESLIEYGYRMEKEAERMTEGGRDRIRYVISLEKERGSDYERSYFEVLLAPADAGRHFLAVIRYDGIDVEHLDETTRDRIYSEALAAAETVLDTAVPTQENDDEAGSYWMEEVSLDPDNPIISEDTIEYGDGQYALSYRLPEHCILIADNIAGKTYYDEMNEVYIQASIIPYGWRTAQDMAEKSAGAEISRIHAAGEVVVNDRTFYYYTYNTLEYAKHKTMTHYYFHAFCDLDDGSIFSVFGQADDFPGAMEETYYLEWMNLSFFDV